MKAIISTSVEFNTPEDVRDYEALDPIDAPEDDMAPTDVVKYKVGYRLIVLERESGAVDVYRRRGVTGMAVDGQPIIIHGQGFQRINCD